MNVRINTLAPNSLRAVGATLALALFCAFPARAQEPGDSETVKPQAAKPADKKPESKVATVEISPAETSAEVGGKVQFKAVAKDASGSVVTEPVKFWFAAPFDISGADSNGLVSVLQPGDITVGALIGDKVGYAKLTGTRSHIAKIELATPAGELSAGDLVQLVAVPRNSTGDPRTDVALTWTSD